MRLRRFSVKRARRLPPSPFGPIGGGMGADLSFRCGARDHPALAAMGRLHVDVQGCFVQVGRRVGDGDAQALGQGAGPGQQRVGLAQGGVAVRQQGAVEHGREQFRTWLASPAAVQRSASS